MPLVVIAAVFGALQGNAVDAADMPAHWYDILTPPIITGVIVCLFLSAFFSGSETAFFSLQRLRLRALAEDGTANGTRIAGMLEHPGRLLSTILVGNTIINVLIGLFLGARVETVLFAIAGLSEPAAIAAAVVITTLVLVFFGEVLPKVIAVRFNERFARITVLPLMAADRVLTIPRDSCLWFTDLLFKITRFHELRAAPFITDEEFRSVLAEGEARNVIERDDLDMIHGILESNDALLKEILVPRPSVTALPDSATVADAIECLRDTEFSRVPIYEENLDKVTGILVAKDMLSSIRSGKLDRLVKTLARPAHFVPQVMTVQQFVRDAQRNRAHLAIVVDEYGGTAGIVTLEDAIEEVVGEILDEGEHIDEHYKELGDGEFMVLGTMPLDELSELIEVDMQDDAHETLGGFIMDQGERIAEVGDTITHEGVEFEVVEVDGKRVESVRVRVPQEAPPPSESEPVK